MLCHVCQSLTFLSAEELDAANLFAAGSKAFQPYVENGSDAYQYYYHQKTFRDLEISSESGCYFCAAMFHGFSNPPDYWKQGKIDEITASSTIPIILRTWQIPHEQHPWHEWEDMPEGEGIIAFCGSYRVHTYRVQSPTGNTIDVPKLESPTLTRRDRPICELR